MKRSDSGLGARAERILGAPDSERINAALVNSVARLAVESRVSLLESRVQAIEERDRRQAEAETQRLHDSRMQLEGAFKLLMILTLVATIGLNLYLRM